VLGRNSGQNTSGLGIQQARGFRLGFGLVNGRVRRSIHNDLRRVPGKGAPDIAFVENVEFGPPKAAQSDPMPRAAGLKGTGDLPALANHENV
jgi:hypothetical protein